MYGLPIFQGNDAQVFADLSYVTLVTDTAILLRLGVLRVAQNRFAPLAFDIASLVTELGFQPFQAVLHVPPEQPEQRVDEVHPSLRLVVLAGPVRSAVPLEPLDEGVQFPRYAHRIGPAEALDTCTLFQRLVFFIRLTPGR